MAPKFFSLLDATIKWNHLDIQETQGTFEEVDSSFFFIFVIFQQAAILKHSFE